MVVSLRTDAGALMRTALDSFTDLVQTNIRAHMRRRRALSKEAFFQHEPLIYFN